MPDFDIVENYHRSGRSADDEFDLPRFQPRPSGTLPPVAAAPSSSSLSSSTNSRYLPPATNSTGGSNMGSYYAPGPPQVSTIPSTYSPQVGGGVGAIPGAVGSGNGGTTVSMSPQQSYQSGLQSQRQHSARLSHILDADSLLSTPSSSSPSAPGSTAGTGPGTWASQLGRSVSLRTGRHGNTLPSDDVERAFGDLPSMGTGMGRTAAMMPPPSGIGAGLKQSQSPGSAAVQQGFYNSSIAYQSTGDHREVHQQPYSLKRSNTSVHSCKPNMLSSLCICLIPP